jgi:CheY-like chemotaxis protein
VDAENLTRRLLDARLQSAGHLVRAAGSAAEAQALIARFGCPDVMITDLVLPDRSALELVSELRCDPDAATLPVIFTSGRDARPADVDAAHDLGGHHLPKPVSPEALAEAVTAALEPVEAAVEHTVRRRLAGFGSLDSYEQELIADLLTAFVQRAPAAQSAAEQAMATGDAEALRSAVRRLKAAALNLGADSLAEICADLDARSDLPVPVVLSARFRRVLGATCRVFAGLVAEFRGTPVDDGLVGVAHA